MTFWESETEIQEGFDAKFSPRKEGERFIWKNLVSLDDDADDDDADDDDADDDADDDGLSPNQATLHLVRNEQ